MADVDRAMLTQTMARGKMGRNPSIEVLRCLLMFLIVLHHAWVNGPWYSNGALWTLVFSTFIHWHTDGFIGISGWFGINFRWKKFIKLWGLVAFYGLIFGNGINACWFGGNYLALMLCAPFVNAAVEGVASKGRDFALRVWGLVALALTLTWMPLHGFTAVNAVGGTQFSFTTFVFVYATARLARLLLNHPLPLRKVLIGPIVFFSSILMIGGSKTLLQVYRGVPQGASAWDWLTVYNAPHVWIMAFSMLMLFVWHVRVPAWLGRLCAFLAPSLFSVYLIHACNDVGTGVICSAEKWLMMNTCLDPCSILMFVSVVVFLVSVLIDLLRRMLLSLIEPLMRGIWQKVVSRFAKENFEKSRFRIGYGSSSNRSGR